MLVSIDAPDKPITRIPHLKEFKSSTSHMSQEEYKAVIQTLNDKIDGGEVHTSSWMPGGNWQGTPFQTIYEKACGHNVAAAGECFGIFVWITMMNRPEKWSFGRYEKDGAAIKGITYFQLPS